jgi:LysM repeat protein
VSAIEGIEPGEAVTAGVTRLLYVSVVGGPDLTVRWEDMNGTIPESNKTSLVYVIPNRGGEAVVTVVVTDQTGRVVTSTIKYQIVLPTPLPTETPTPTQTPEIPPTSSPAPTATPSITPMPSETPTPEMKPTIYQYTAVDGDTLPKISRKYFFTEKFGVALGRANCIDILNTGDKLTIKYYVVKPGDTLTAIAERFHISVDFLKSINDFEGDTIYPGNIFILPMYGQCK